MPNNEDEWIDEVLETLQDKLNDHPGVATEVGWEKIAEEKQEYVAEAKATIKAKLLEARIDEVEGSLALSGIPPAQRVRALERRRLELIAQLQASAPTKKGEDHE